MQLTDIFVPSSGAAWLPLADALIKSTLLLAAGALAALALRRATAAARHLVWTLALLGSMVLPLLSLALPRWQLPVVRLPSSSVRAAESPSLTGPPAALFPAPASMSEQRTFPAVPSVVALNIPSAASSVSRGRPGMALGNVAWRDLLLSAWLIGAAAVLLRLVTGLAAVQWLSRRTDRIEHAPWLPLARTLATQLGLAQVVFRRSAVAAMPMAWGILRPAVVMPADADAWPAERLRIVLLHELAHVKRRDCLTHMLAQISCALYWFNPLAWVAARHLRMERERACDDLVLAAGTRGSDYADQLLQIARRTRDGRFPRLFGAASLAMAQRSQLEGRLMAILDPTVPHSGVSRFRTIAASSMFAFAVVPLASIQPWIIEAPRETPSNAAAVLDDSHQPMRGAPRASRPWRERDGRADRARSDRTAVQTNSPAVATVPAVAPAASLPAAALAGATPSSAAAAFPVVTPMPEPTPIVAAGAQTTTDKGSSTGAEGKGKAADPRAVAALTAALKDTDKGVRESALQALVRLRDPGVFDPLVQALADVEADVREHAAFGLGQLRDSRAVEPLGRALKDQIADVREQAAFALGQLRDRRAVEPLISALKDADADVREQAAFALGQLRDGGGVEALVIALKDSAPAVREQVAFALGQIRDPRAIDALTTALKDATAEVRQQAAFALGQLIQ